MYCSGNWNGCYLFLSPTRRVNYAGEVFSIIDISLEVESWYPIEVSIPFIRVKVSRTNTSIGFQILQYWYRWSNIPSFLRLMSALNDRFVYIYWLRVSIWDKFIMAKLRLKLIRYLLVILQLEFTVLNYLNSNCKPRHICQFIYICI